MSKRTDLVAEQLHKLAADLEGLWIAATHDPKKEARRERAWAIFSGVARPRPARPAQRQPEVAEQKPAAVEERAPTAVSSAEG
jgi:hypothetical protein